MKLFMCFGGAAAAAAVIDDEAAEVAARHLQGQRRRGRRSLSFRGKSFLHGNSNKGGNEKKPSPTLDQPKKRGMHADEDVYGVSRASSVASSALLSLSTASSLDSDTSSASSSSSSRASTASSSPSVSGVLYPPPFKRQASDNKRPASSSSLAAGAAAVVLCLLMVVVCGRLGATLLMSTALYLFPRRWPARAARKEKKGAVDSLECDAAASANEAEEEETAKRKVVTEGSLVRNRNKVKR